MVPLALSLVVTAVGVALHYHVYRKQQLAATYQRQFDLVKIGIENGLGHIGTARHLQPHACEILYANLWVVHWARLWDTRKLSKVQLQRAAADLFENPNVRAWWMERGKDWSSTSSRRRSDFVSIMTEECRSAEAREELRKRVSH